MSSTQRSKLSDDGTADKPQPSKLNRAMEKSPRNGAGMSIEANVQTSFRVINTAFCFASGLRGTVRMLRLSLMHHAGTARSNASVRDLFAGNHQSPRTGRGVTRVGSIRNTMSPSANTARSQYSNASNDSADSNEQNTGRSRDGALTPTGGAPTAAGRGMHLT